MITLPIPTGLRAAGKKMWETLCAFEHLENEDYFFVLDLCKNADELKLVEAEFKRVGDFTVWTNNEQTIMLHPLRKEIDTLNKARREMLRELGLSVKQRKMLELSKEVIETDAVQDAQGKLGELRGKL